MGCGWHRGPGLVQKASAGAVSSQRWLCRLPGSRGSHGAVLEEPRVQASVLTLPALVTKAAGTRHNPTAGQCWHTPSTCGRSKAGCSCGEKQTQKHRPAALAPPYHVIAQVVPLAYQRGQPPTNPYCDGFVDFFFNSSFNTCY